MTIAQISDLHCGGPHFVPNFLERAISEINDLQPDVDLLGRPDDVRLQGGVRAGEGLPRPDRVRLGRGDPGQSRLAQRRLRPLRGAVRRPQLRAAGRGPDGRRGRLDGARSRPRPDRPRRYRWIEEQFSLGDPAMRIFVLHHHLLLVPGTGRERNVVYDAGDAIECLQRAGVHPSSPGTSTCPTRGGSRISSSSTP